MTRIGIVSLGCANNAIDSEGLGDEAAAELMTRVVRGAAG